MLGDWADKLVYERDALHKMVLELADALEYAHDNPESLYNYRELIKTARSW